MLTIVTHKPFEFMNSKDGGYIRLWKDEDDDLCMAIFSQNKLTRIDHYANHGSYAFDELKEMLEE